MTALDEARAAIEHVDRTADRDTFNGDLAEYLTRQTARAQALATLAVAEQLGAIWDELDRGNRAARELVELLAGIREQRP